MPGQRARGDRALLQRDVAQLAEAVGVGRAEALGVRVGVQDDVARTSVRGHDLVDCQDVVVVPGLPCAGRSAWWPRRSGRSPGRSCRRSGRRTRWPRRRSARARGCTSGCIARCRPAAPSRRRAAAGAARSAMAGSAAPAATAIPPGAFPCCISVLSTSATAITISRVVVTRYEPLSENSVPSPDDDVLTD